MRLFLAWHLFNLLISWRIFGAFAPPPTPEGVHTAFWETIRRMERRQAAHSRREERHELVDRIARDLASLPEGERLQTMERFLSISHHYRLKENPELPEEARSAHRAEFLAGIRAFREMARRELEERNNRVYLDLLASVRALASAGREGVRLSQDLAGVDPDNPVIRRNLAQDLLDTGDYQSAIEAGQRAVELDPSSAQAYTILAAARYSLNDPNGAMDAASKALERNPGDSLAYSILKLAETRVPSERASREGPEGLLQGEAYTEAAARISMRYGEARGEAASRNLSASAGTEFRRGDFRRATELASRALATEPGNAGALYWRALSSLRMDAPAQALSDADAAAAAAGIQDAAWLMLRARALNLLGRHADALDAAESALAMDPESVATKAELFFQKAWALAGLNRRKDAVRALSAAARLDPRFEPYYQGLLILPEGGDLMALFRGELDLEPQPPLKSPSLGRRMLIVGLSSLSGGLLIALGLLHILSSDGRSRLRKAFSKAASAPAQPPLPPPAPAGPGTLLGGSYEITRRIGAGGMGVVYEAIDRNLERRVAIKQLREEIGSDPRNAERILHEARTVAALRHPHIVEIYSVLGRGSGLFLVFEYVDGHTVADYVRQHTRIPFDWALKILQNVASALDYAHGRGIIHRDLKPSNIMIDRDGTVKVMDFGVAGEARDTLRRITAPSGTPPYMAPEQEQGRPRKESDVYAMGVTLYELVTGKLPFAGSEAGMALSKMNESYVPPSRLNPFLPQHFDRVLSWALAADPSKRWRTPGQFVRNLAALLPSQHAGIDDSDLRPS